MEWLPPDFPIWAVIGMAFASFIGSLMYGLVRKIASQWTKAVTLLTSTSSGPILTPAICGWLGFVDVNQHMAVSFVVGLLVMPIVNSAVAASEEDAKSWFKALVGRVFGFGSSSPSNIKEPPQVDDGGN